MKKSKQNAQMINAELKLTIAGIPCEFHISVPEKKSTLNEILPFVREVTNKTIDIAVADFTKDGKEISCKKGCGACCSQLVPISEIEIREIAKLIKSYPKTKKKALMDKFDAAKLQLSKAELWETLSQPQNIDDEDISPLGRRYFSQQIACPFLEEGACSIHPVRPLSCREFLVTSNPKYCATLNEQNTVTVDIPTRISNAFANTGKHDAQFTAKWVPLILAPYWQQLHPNQLSKKTGPQWIEEFLSHINPNK